MSLKLDYTLECFRNIKKCRGLGASWWFGGWDSVLSLPSCTVLSCFSHVQLIVAVWTETHQTPLSVGVFRPGFNPWLGNWDPTSPIA